MSDVIRIENLNKIYHVGEVDLHVLKGVSVRIARAAIAKPALRGTEPPDARLLQYFHLGHRLKLRPKAFFGIQEGQQKSA